MHPFPWPYLLGILETLVAPVPAEEVPSPMVRTQLRWSSGEGEPAYGGHCLVYTPPGDERRAWPLVIFLHGAGHRGTELARLEAAHIPRMIERGHVFPAIVACPQASGYWRDDEAIAAVDDVLVQLGDRVDPDRVYLTGESSGGAAVWAVAKARADRLAAIVPICPFTASVEGVEPLATLPIWAFRNVHDPYSSVENSRKLVAAVRELGNPNVRYTELDALVGKKHPTRGIYPNTHRHAWETAYADPQMWSWLFAQRRERR